MSRWIVVCALVQLACACERQKPPAPPASEPAEPRSPAALAEAQVYDEQGEPSACEAPKEKCPDRARNTKFLDQCRLRGYQVRRCGCQELCSGNAMMQKPYYDTDGNQKECADEEPDCTPPNTSAAFQDACTDAHHRLVICGCEWLCDGPPNP